MIRLALILVGSIGFSGVLLAQNTSVSSSGSKTEHSHMAMKSTPLGDKANVQTKCPVMAGNAIDTSVYAIWKGDATHSAKKVYFCCPGCIDKFNANPLKYVNKLEKMKQPIEDFKTEELKSK